MKYDYKQTIYSDGSPYFIYSKGGFLFVKIRVYKKNPIKNIFIATNPEGERIFTLMKKNKKDYFFQYWQSKIKITTPKISYKFFISTKNDSFWYSQTGITIYIPSDGFDFKHLLDYKPPSWLKNAVFYQIFSDRFCNGNPSINVKENEYVYCGKYAKTMPWGQSAKEYDPKVHLQFCGGDLAGIRQKIPYLKSLGINALYLTPIFLSPSPHKYDVQDYYKIDPHFGTNKEFAAFVKLLHKNNIKIILDGVFNHCGAAHYWFNKYDFYKKGGAYKNKNSPYYEFFKFYNHPHDYKCWLGVKTLPKLNYKSEKLKNIIYKGENSIAKYWLKPPYNIDGWRLDVANMIARMDDFQEHFAFWKEFYKNVKKMNQKSYILGEHFFDAQELLQGEMLDAVMNYQGFYFPVISWFTQKYEFPESKNRIETNLNFTSENLSEALIASRGHLPWQIQQLMYNLLNSHDTARFYTLVNHNKSLLKGALILLFTYIGIPSIFYGDEIGLQGKNSIDARCCMIWEKENQDKEIYETIKKLINLRKNEMPLKTGGIKIIYSKDNIFSFARFIKNNFVISVINKGGKQSIFLPLWNIGKFTGKLKDIFSKKEFKIKNGELKLNLDKYESFCFIGGPGRI